MRIQRVIQIRRRRKQAINYSQISDAVERKPGPCHRVGSQRLPVGPRKSEWYKRSFLRTFPQRQTAVLGSILSAVEPGATYNGCYGRSRTCFLSSSSFYRTLFSASEWKIKKQNRAGGKVGTLGNISSLASLARTLKTRSRKGDECANSLKKTLSVSVFSSEELAPSCERGTISDDKGVTRYSLTWAIFSTIEIFIMMSCRNSS